MGERHMIWKIKKFFSRDVEFFKGIFPFSHTKKEPSGERGSIGTELPIGDDVLGVESKQIVLDLAKLAETRPDENVGPGSGLIEMNGKAEPSVQAQ